MNRLNRPRLYRLKRQVTCEELEWRLLLTSSSSPAAEFTRLAPLGGLALASLDNAGVVSDATNDQIDFTFSLNDGESVSALATPQNAGAILTVSYINDGGTVSSARASSVGQPISLPLTQGLSDAATVRVTSSVPTEFTLNIYRNVNLESSIIESSPNELLELGSSTIDGLTRYAALGSTALQSNETIVLSESFDASTAFNSQGLWHTSEGRSNDGLANHTAGALYFGQAEQAAPPTGTLDWNADFDPTVDRLWESTANNSASTRWNFGSTIRPGSDGAASNLNGIDAWFALGTAAATMDSFEDIRGDDATEQDASFEFVFRPRNFSGTHILFETGGNGDGTAFLLVDNELEVRVQNSDNNTRRVVRTFAFDAAADANKFHHVVVTIQPSRSAAQNQVRLFVNGTEVGVPESATSVIADWAGTDSSGLGRANGGFADSDDTTLSGNFDGDIALFRFFENQLLAPNEVRANYGSLVSGSDLVLGSYDTGERVQGDATSPPFSLTGNSDFTLSFSMLAEVEDAEEPFELMQVVLFDTATMEEEILLDRFDGTLPASTGGSWTDVEVDLSPFREQVVQIIFRFDSVDNSNNAFEGWWIDDFRVTRSQTPAADVDQYAIDLSKHVGETVDILLAGQSRASYADQQLELRDANGSALLATGVINPIADNSNATNYDLGILGYEVQSPGFYTVRVSSDAKVANEQYALLVNAAATLETEPNEVATSALRVFESGNVAVTGYLRSGTVQAYASRGAFEADNPGLEFEDFENGVVSPSGVAVFDGTLSDQTSNSVFPSGINSGVTISATDQGLALVGADFFDPALDVSQAVGPDVFTADTNLAFAPPVTAVGLDILGNAQVEVRIYNSSNQLIESTLVDASPTGAFFGAASSQPISRMELVEVVRSGELIDNLSFGNAGVTTTADADAFAISLSAGDAIRVATSTPLGSTSEEPLNTLDPRLVITGPGVNVSDDDSATDGKNAVVDFTAPVAGNYVVRVEAQSGEGEYVVSASPPVLSGVINGDGFIVLTANDLNAQGLNFFSEGGFLVPISDNNTEPFDFALSNTANQITIGNLGSTVLLDGTFITNVRYIGDEPETDLSASYGENAVEVPFTIKELPSVADPLDCNQDGTTDSADLNCICGTEAVDELLTRLDLRPGDFDADGTVAFADFLALARTFGQSTTSYTEGDVNCSGTVDFEDFLVLARNFGT